MEDGGRAGRRILVVEDNHDLRDELMTGFVARGFQVTAAGDGALGARAATDDRHDVVLLDLEMPSLDGLRLAQVLSAVAPATRLVIMSGHGYLRTAARDLLGGSVPVLAKPFDLDDLLHLIAAPPLRT
ncbi:response regulator [Oleomonas cavernae]|uniref:Response regulator n=1 Tax=Oleomonas cavernae TaxID=2320859 RepID=A0A418WHS6_9PROT|nr:response regulator [Oleomonas cavernae]RJF89594.1 response regulator [Oleomonas cavernae]